MQQGLRLELAWWGVPISRLACVKNDYCAILGLTVGTEGQENRKRNGLHHLIFPDRVMYRPGKMTIKAWRLDMNAKAKMMMLFGVVLTLGGCGGGEADSSDVGGGEVTLEAVEKQYQLTFSPGGNSPEEAFEKAVTAMATNDYTAFVQVSTNEDMAIYGLVEALMNGYQFNLKNGREEFAAGMKTRIDSLLTPELEAEYRAMGTEAVEKNRERFDRMTKTFGSYVDYSAIDYSNLEVKNAPASQEKMMVVYAFTNPTNQKDCNINMNFVQMKGKWYATGENGASC